MNDTIWEELNFILNKFGKEEPDEHIKIKHICTKVLDCEEYESLIKKSLDSMFNIPNFDISDFSRLMLAIIEINNQRKSAISARNKEIIKTSCSSVKTP